MNRLSIVMYHYVRNLAASRYPAIKGLDLKLFYEQLAFLKEHFAFISTEQLLQALDEGTPLPERAVWLTFDDGYIDHYTNVFPILRREKIPAFFSMPGKILAEHKLLDVNKIHFLLAGMPVKELLPLVFERLDHYRGSEFPIEPNETLWERLAKPNRFDSGEVIFIKRLLQVELPEALRARMTDDLFRACIPLSEEAFAEELYLNEEQVAFMQREGMCFGIHGYDHYWMNRLTPQELEQDITRALQTFSGIVDPNRWVCCYPYGSCSEEVIRHIRGRGAAAGITTEVAAAAVSEENRFTLPRLDTNDFPPKSENYQSCL